MNRICCRVGFEYAKTPMVGETSSLGTPNPFLDYHSLVDYFKSVAGTSANGSCHEHQNPRNDCLSAYLLPKYSREGAHVTHFSMSLAQAKQLVKTELNKTTLEEAFNWPGDVITLVFMSEVL